jgi:hypothetical protein
MYSALVGLDFDLLLENSTYIVGPRIYALFY